MCMLIGLMRRDILTFLNELRHYNKVWLHDLNLQVELSFLVYMTAV